MNPGGRNRYDVRRTTARAHVLAVMRRIRRARGRAAAVAGEIIAAELGISEREVQKIVQYLAKKRLRIGTAWTRPFGYYWITSDAERRLVRAQFIRRAMEILERVRALDSDKLLAPIVGQMTLLAESDEEASR